VSYLNLEHKLLSVFREESLNKNLIVSVSGGLDSMALLSVLCELQKQLGLNLIVGHIHHGPSDDQEQEKYRQKSHDLVKKICESYKIQFISNYSTQPSKVLKSEAEFRQLREQNYESWLQTYADYNIVLGHHKNDVLENRLIQLIRGCGEKGFLSLASRFK